MNFPLPSPVDFHESDLAGRRVLVVDDDEAMLTAVSKVLRHAGATVDAARGVEEAVAFLSARDASFDLVLTDLRMPGLEGSSLITITKQTNPNVPVVIMSAFWTQEDKQECLELGANNFLDKPLRSWHLLASVVKAISLSQKSEG